MSRRWSLFLPLFIASISQGGRIVDNPNNAGGGLGMAGVVGLNPVPNPNNDDPEPTLGNPHGTSPNAPTISKTFNAVAPIDMEFRVSNSGGTTEYFFTDVVTNKTGVEWTDYHFELGFGTGAGFVASGLMDFLDFDCPLPSTPTPTSTDFTTLIHRCNTIDWKDGKVANDAKTTFTFSIDVPDFAAALFAAQGGPVPDSARIPNDAFGFPRGGYKFTLRQLPTVEPKPAPPVDGKVGEAIPEPTTLAMLLSAAVAFFVHRKIVPALRRTRLLN